jgi:hypothetical protein
MTATADRAALRGRLIEGFARKLDKYVRESGGLCPWTISELEQSLLADITQLARDVIESRIDVDPVRAPAETPRCPDCGAALASRQVPTHRHTLFGRIGYERAEPYAPLVALRIRPAAPRARSKGRRGRPRRRPPPARP